MVMALNGNAKLVEETGELLQVVGKLLAFPYQDEHPDGKGSLKTRLEDEVADVLASLRLTAHLKNLDMERIDARVQEKLELFLRWHADPRDTTRPPDQQDTYIETYVGLTPEEIARDIGIDPDEIDMEPTE